MPLEEIAVKEWLSKTQMKQQLLYSFRTQGRMQGKHSGVGRVLIVGYIYIIMWNIASCISSFQIYRYSKVHVFRVVDYCIISYAIMKKKIIISSFFIILTILLRKRGAIGYIENLHNLMGSSVYVPLQLFQRWGTFPIHVVLIGGFPIQLCFYMFTCICAF